MQDLITLSDATSYDKVYSCNTVIKESSEVARKEQLLRKMYLVCICSQDNDHRHGPLGSSTGHRPPQKRRLQVQTGVTIYRNGPNQTQTDRNGPKRTYEYTETDFEEYRNGLK